MNESLKKTLMILEPIVLTILILTLVFFIYTVRTEGSKCMANPLVYGSDILSEQNQANFTCSCQFSNSLDYTIRVNRNSWELVNSRIEQFNKEISIDYTMPNLSVFIVD